MCCTRTRGRGVAGFNEIGCKNSKETGVGTEDGETWCAEEEEESHKQEHFKVKAECCEGSDVRSQNETRYGKRMTSFWVRR